MVVVALRSRNGNNRTCQKIGRDTTAPHTIVEACSRGEMPKEG